MNVTKGISNAVNQLAKIESSAFSVLKPGDIVEGEVLDTSAAMLMVDLGKHGTGVVYRGELQNARETVKDLSVGSKVHAKVVSIDNEDGYVELSLAEASKQKAWAEVSELAERGEVIKVKISGTNRGGALTEISGLQAFLPFSQFSSGRYTQSEEGSETTSAEQAEKLIGQEVSVKIVEVNPRARRLIVSERDAIETSGKEFIDNYEVGQIVEGIISGVADFGAFIKFTDNPAVEGMIHVSELDYRMVESPKEIVKVDDVVKAKITEIKDGKISLSLKALSEDPWDAVEKKYKEGQEIEGVVYSFTPFGAVVNFDNVQGYVHITAFGSIEEMKKMLMPETAYRFIIENIEPEKRRISLKLVS